MATQMATQMQGLRAEIMDSMDARMGSLELKGPQQGVITHAMEDVTPRDSTSGAVTNGPVPAISSRQPHHISQGGNTTYQLTPTLPTPPLQATGGSTYSPVASGSAAMCFRDSYTDAAQEEFPPLPTVTYADSDQVDDNTKAINNLLVAAGSALGRKRGKQSHIPHTYILRGEKDVKIARGEATWPEHFGALLRMGKDAAVPQSWKDPILEHMHQLTIMAVTWDWPTCRLWSEKTFAMIGDGRLPGGWDDMQAVKEIQRDVCMVGNRVDAASQRRSYTGQRATSTQFTTQSNTTQDTKTEYNRETDGKPCHPWNWGNECGFTASHGQHPDRKPHICAWCANKYHRTNVHQEKACINKKRFQEKKATTPTEQQTNQVFQ